MTLAWEYRDGVLFRHAIGMRLAKSPLAAVQSGRDGSPLAVPARPPGAPLPRLSVQFPQQ